MKIFDKEFESKVFSLSFLFIEKLSTVVGPGIAQVQKQNSKYKKNRNSFAPNALWFFFLYYRYVNLISGGKK